MLTWVMLCALCSSPSSNAAIQKVQQQIQSDLSIIRFKWIQCKSDFNVINNGPFNLTIAGSEMDETFSSGKIVQLNLNAVDQWPRVFVCVFSSVFFGPFSRSVGRYFDLCLATQKKVSIHLHFVYCQWHQRLMFCSYRNEGQIMLIFTHYLEYWW